jgi:ADP-heptose:LPS heptosyltransferase
MGSGMARGARARGKRIAFGDGRRIHWHANAHLIFQGNENVAPPGSERDRDIVWIGHYTAHRLYGTPRNGGWRWNEDFRATPGEMFFTPQEIERAAFEMPAGAVLIEPHVKALAPNKRWPWERYKAVAKQLARDGHQVVQFNYGQRIVPGATAISSPDFRTSLAMLARCSLYIGPEGGLHHGAAAVGTPAVVIFGGYIHPMTTGYATHVNLFGADEACGNTQECWHCRQAMDAIEAEQVLDAARGILDDRRDYRSIGTAQAAAE